MQHTYNTTTNTTPAARPDYMAGGATRAAYRVAIMAACRALRRNADTLPTPHTAALYGSAVALSRSFDAVGIAAFDGQPAADTVQAALVGLLEYAARQGLTIANIVNGYTDTGDTLTLTTYKGTGDARRVAIVTGQKVAYLVAARAANAWINKNRTYTDNKAAVDDVSQGSDFTAPAAFDKADTHSFDHAQALEFFSELQDLCKGDNKALSIAVLTMQGYTQKETAARVGCSQQLVSRKLAKVRQLLTAQRQF